MAKTNITTDDIKKAYEDWQALIVPSQELERQVNALTSAWRERKIASRFSEVEDEGLAAEFEQYKVDHQRLCDAWSDAKSAESAAKRAYEEMRVVYVRQCANLVRQAMYEHLDDLDGKPARYKRTMRAVQSICDEALEGTRCVAFVYDSSITVYDSEFPYGHREDCSYSTRGAGTFDREFSGRWYGHGNVLVSETQQLTADDVTRLCKDVPAVIGELSRLRDAYIESCDAILGPYGAVDYDLREALRSEAVVLAYKL